MNRETKPRRPLENGYKRTSATTASTITNSTPSAIQASHAYGIGRWIYCKMKIVIKYETTNGTICEKNKTQ